MTPVYFIAASVAVGLFLYLLAALFKPEMFE